jgi:mono/diheme cytochrome c family protein
MPATEQTWRNVKTMHVVFGITSLLMLIGTIWMFADDHLREWKRYQREFRKVQVAATDARISELKTSEWSARERELQQAVTRAEQQVPDADLVALFRRTIEDRAKLHPATARVSDSQAIQQAFDRVKQAAQENRPEQVAQDRKQLFKLMDDAIKLARDYAVRITGQVKFERANLDVRRSEFDITVRDERPQPVIDAALQTVAKQEELVDKLSLEMQAANIYRQELDRIKANITTDETLAKKALDDHRLTLARLETQKREQGASLGERVLEFPIIDAFGRPLKIEQIWLPKLTINNNFRDVARFDRCITCHKGINMTAAGSAVDPAYPLEQHITFTLDTPDERPAETDEQGQPVELTLEGLYGMRLAEKELNPGQVRIDAVWAERPAAKAPQVRQGDEPPLVVDNPPGTFAEADFHTQLFQKPPGLRAGDVIVMINDVKIDSPAAARRELIDNLRWGRPLSVTVKRGMPNPYASHPRLDLFVGSSSPHDMQKMGCTVCHDGQGSATSFHWASHTPNNEFQREQWTKEHGWAPNHHWIFPMFPQRFAESTCLKCHHEVVDLLPSKRFPDPPAPKLLEGYNIVREFGCFGCHEINGYDGPTRRIGPDLRAEPNYVAAAQQLLTDQGLTEEEIRLASNVVRDPTNLADRQRLAELIKADQGLLVGPESAGEAAAKPRLASASYKLADLIGADDEAPGEFRKVGPSLRHLASKVDQAFTHDWIRDPQHFRPSTKMPRFFGLYDHLLPEEQTETVDGRSRKVMAPAPGLEVAHKFEPVEVRAITHYLLKHSQPFEYIEPAKDAAEASAERGRELFETRGCLACHQHPAFPDAKAAQGPTLARLGDKLRSEESHKWLYSWLREPTHYHARTLMPNLFLTSYKHKEGDQEITIDPAADIAAFLLAGSEDLEKYEPGPEEPLNETHLDELAYLHLRKVFTEVQTRQYLKEGIPEYLRSEIKGDEAALIGDASIEAKLEYVGRRAINKYGCFGCHDIPGYETAKPIGTGLADWGRKEPEKLAFEQIAGLIDRLHGHGSSHSTHATERDAGAELDQVLPASIAEQAALLHQFDPDGIFTHALLSHERMGFLWQKLRAPRSFDYMKTDTKEYNDRLRMPKFNFTPEQVEAVMTFVLGLVAEPPASQYVYRPTPQRHAVIEGQKLLEQFNCGGCHTLQYAGWKFEFDPQSFPEAAEFNDYDFLKPYFTTQQLEASKQVDRRGMAHAMVHGMPVVDGEGNLLEDEDDEGNPLFYFTLFENQPINGQAWLSGSQVQVSRPNLIATRPPVGGYLSRLIYPAVLAKEREANPNAKESDAWGWVPPPLVGEGSKVQTNWLHEFLLDPYPIRPAVVLRMPRFNMTSMDARKLVNYFAAIDQAEYPFEFDPRRQQSYLAEADAAHPGRLDEAMKVVTNGNYCIKCHHLGDFVPEGSVAAQAPQLDRIYQRLRPEYLRNWVANPQKILPYTAMPVNFPPDKPADQALFPGDSQEQLTAVVDLLLNYDTFMKNRQSIKPLIQAAPPEQQQAQQVSEEPLGGQ